MIQDLVALDVVDTCALGQILGSERYLPRVRLGVGNVTLNALGLCFANDAKIFIPRYRPSSNRVLSFGDIRSLGYQADQYTAIVLPGPGRIDHLTILETLANYVRTSAARQVIVVNTSAVVSQEWINKLEQVFWSSAHDSIIYATVDQFEDVLQPFEQIVYVHLVEHGSSSPYELWPTLESRLHVLSILLDQKMSVVDIACGPVGCAQLRNRLDEECTTVLNRQFQRIIVSAGGAPWDRAVFAGFRAYANIEPILAPDGVVYLVCKGNQTTDFSGLEREHIHCLPKFYEQYTELRGEILLDPFGRTKYEYRT